MEDILYLNEIKNHTKKIPDIWCNFDVKQINITISILIN